MQIGSEMILPRIKWILRQLSQQPGGLLWLPLSYTLDSWGCHYMNWTSEESQWAFYRNNVEYHTQPADLDLTWWQCMPSWTSMLRTIDSHHKFGQNLSWKPIKWKIMFICGFSGEASRGSSWKGNNGMEATAAETCLAAGLEILALPTSTASTHRTLWKTCIPLRNLEEQILG